MPLVLPPGDYHWLIPGAWRVRYRHPRGAKLFVRCRRVKLRFECSDRAHSWSSLEGCMRAMIWESDDGDTHILVMLGLEECKVCGQAPVRDGIHTYRKEFASVLKSIVSEYRQPAGDRKSVHHAPGRPTSPHDSGRCEPCRKGWHRA